MYFVRKGVEGETITLVHKGYAIKVILSSNQKKISNIKIISDDVFDMISEFIIAQRNVLTEL